MVHDNGNQFLAQGTLTRNAIAVKAIIRGSYPTFELGSVSCVATLEATNWPEGFWQSRGWPPQIGGIEVNGHTAGGGDIWIPDWKISLTRYTGIQDERTWSGLTVEGAPNLFAIGDLRDFSIQPEQVQCVITLSPTPLGNLSGMLISNPDGTVTRLTGQSEEEERKGIRWQTELGEAELIDNYEWYPQQLDLGEATLRVRRSQIVLTIQPTAVSSLKALFARLEDLLFQPLLLVSFLSRTRIDWLKAEATAIGPASSRMFAHATAVREPAFGFESLRTIGRQSSVVPVKVQELREGLFQTMLSTYQTSPLQDTIRQTMSYEASSREQGYYFEALLGLVYAGLEGLVDGLSTEHDLNLLLSGSAFKRLASAVRKVIESLVPDKEIAALVCSKVAELQRRSFKDTLLRLLQRYDLDKVQVFPGGQYLTDAVPDLINRRNTYTHQGKLDYAHHGDDFGILQALLELWVLRLLACPRSAIDGNAYLDVLKLPE